MKKKIILIIYLLSIMVGIDYEFSVLGSLKLDNSKYLELLVAISLLGIYIVPGILLLKKLNTKLSKIEYFVPIAIFSGCFIPGWLSGLSNSSLENILSKFFGSTEMFDNWSAALTAPFVEEFFKIICVLMILYLFKVTALKSVFLIGISVGLGFQIMEDISYLAEEMNSSQSIFEQLFARISGAIASHWAYTGIFSIGITAVFRKQQLFSKKEIYSFVIIPIVLHFLWNSPMNDFSFNGIALLSPILSVVTLLLIFKISLELQETQTTSLNNSYE